MKTSTFKNNKISLISIITIIMIWKGASLIYANEALLPSPESVVLSLLEAFQSPDFIKIICYTLLRGFTGFILSLIMGMIFGTLAGMSRYVEKSLSPLLTVMKSTPIMSIMLLLLIWFGTEKTPIFAGFMVSFPIIYTNMMQGTKNVDRSLIEMAKIYGIDPIHIIKDIYFPSTAPFLFAGIASAFSIGWKVTVGAEVLSQPKYAIGSKMWESKLFLEIDALLAWTISAILLSFFIEVIIKIMEEKVVGWKYETESKRK